MFIDLKFSHIVKFIFIALFLLGCGTTATSTVEPSVPPTKQSIYYSNTTVTLTFDDGDADNYIVRDVLRENNLRATFYVVSGFTGTEGFMTEDQLRGLYEDGNEIGGHTLSHTKLSDVRAADLRKEICQDRLNLMAYGFEVTSFAYPYGFHDEESRQAVKDCGYNNARTVADGPEMIPPANSFTLKAMPYIVQDTKFQKMSRYVMEVEQNGGGWAIFVFHHVCDGCDQYAIDYDTFSKFADWLGYQQQANGLKIKTIDEVIGGEVQPGAEP